MRHRVFAVGALIAMLAVFASGSPAAASTTQETQFQDDTMLVYPPAGEVAQTLTTLRSLGVDRVRVSVYWRLVAPSPSSRTVPAFKPGGADDPASYPKDNWRPYDNLVRLAAERGIAVNFNVAGDAPDWATEVSPDDEVRNHYYPSPGAFGSFVRAVGTRYSGAYVPPVVTTAPPKRRPNVGGIPLPIGPTTPGETNATPGTGEPLPRVSYWSIWNEPNQSFFLAPQWRGDNRVSGGRVEAAPRIYRQIVDAAANALVATGHINDVVLIGETAPVGRDSKLLKSSLRPLPFIRRLYCVDDKLRPLRGSYARALGCPTANQATEFPKLHPALFNATGYAHHPYSLLTIPSVQSAEPDNVGIQDLGRLTHTLAAIRARYGYSGTLPIFYTEFGYQSKPPDPFGFSLSKQAEYINQSEFIGYSSRFVSSYHQFLLRDAAPNRQHPKGSVLYWGSFQTGIQTLGGTRKPAYTAFRMPLWIPGARRKSGGSFRIWGVLRPARNNTTQTAEIQFRPRSGGEYRTIKSVTFKNMRNVIDTRVDIRQSGNVRIKWRSLTSRVQQIRLG